MRIISGKARGLKLKTLKGLNTRPTIDRIKESLFNIISFRLLDCKVLDVFSGSGSLAIEALSRGAKRAVLIDNNRESISIIKENLENAHFKDYAEVYCGDYSKVLKSLKDKYDIIFVDPPYAKNLYVDILQIINDLNLLNQDGIIIIEHEKRNELQNEISNFKLFDRRSYGKISLSFYRI